MTAQTLGGSRRSHRWWGLLGFAAAVTVAAGVGAFGVSGTAAEYQQLEQPGWAPPSWLFGPVWTVLYAMIAVSGWLVWRRVGLGPALYVYGVQLVLNAGWTPLFFGAGQYGAAFLDICLLWVAIGATVFLFRRVRPVAAGLLVPYWLWVSYAAALNLAIWTMNT